MKCKICSSKTFSFADATVLMKYNVSYFQCSNCGFVQTETPYWLEEAYYNPIATSDFGMAARNIIFSMLTSSVIVSIFDQGSKFLDYGCGYGLLVRLMRDLRFDFYSYDKFCRSLFYQGFEENNSNADVYKLITAFEDFEHFVDSLNEIKDILKFSTSILFNTELLPLSNPKPVEWYYYAPHEGQHLSIYTFKSLEIIAEKLNLNLYTNKRAIHLLTEKKLPDNFSEALNFSRYEPIKVFQELNTLLKPITPRILNLSGKLEQKNQKTLNAKEKSL